jgi:RimJ/RimL family protein N-acetyltransferase
MAPLRSHTIRTERLTLRPIELGDAERFVRIQANWKVGRKLRMADYPPNLEAMTSWLAAAQGEWVSGTAFRFAVLEGKSVIGCADIDEIADGWGDPLSSERAPRSQHSDRRATRRRCASGVARL